jgi:methionine aminopeptidase
MAIDIKSVDAIEKMRIAGRLAAQVLDMIFSLPTHRSL